VLATIASQVGAAIDNAQLFAQLVQAERMAVWGEMSAMSSHMIGNRVFAIKGDLNELEYRLGAGAAAGPDEIAPLVESMKRGIFRLEELLAEFRDFVRATALNTSPLDVTELTASVVEETFPKRGAVPFPPTTPSSRCRSSPTR
jgi:nitrogen fixation/metabolism regulation signal transduction histidine kinase